jgi:hypothetical protein
MRDHQERDDEREDENIKAKRDCVESNESTNSYTVTDIQSRSVNDAYLAARMELANRMEAGTMRDPRRYASEAAALSTLGGDAVNLDSAAKNFKLGLKGNNYPTYDVSSSKEIASVKTHWTQDGLLNESAISRYKNDFAHMMGWGREPNALREDGQNTLGARDAGVPVPNELHNASEEDAAVYLRENSVLRIPDNHVQTVRLNLENNIRQFPGNYYLPDSPSAEQIEKVLVRVQGIGVTSHQLRDLTNEYRDKDYMDIRDVEKTNEKDIKKNRDYDDNLPANWRPRESTLAAIEQPRAKEWIDAGFQTIRVDAVDIRDLDHVRSSDDFRKVSKEEMIEGFKKLDSIVAPAVRRGADNDYFRRLDQAEGLSYQNGYQRIYEAFYGDSSIRLERDGEVYGVVNGAHRLYVARELGRESVPARVIERKKLSDS